MHFVIKIHEKGIVPHSSLRIQVRNTTRNFLFERYLDRKYPYLCVVFDHFWLNINKDRVTEYQWNMKGKIWSWHKDVKVGKACGQLGAVIVLLTSFKVSTQQVDWLLDLCINGVFKAREIRKKIENFRLVHWVHNRPIKATKNFISSQFGLLDRERKKIIKLFFLIYALLIDQHHILSKKSLSPILLLIKELLISYLSVRLEIFLGGLQRFWKGQLFTIIILFLQRGYLMYRLLDLVRGRVWIGQIWPFDTIISWVWLDLIAFHMPFTV